MTTTTKLDIKRILDLRVQVAEAQVDEHWQAVAMAAVETAWAKQYADSNPHPRAHERVDNAEAAHAEAQRLHSLADGALCRAEQERKALDQEPKPRRFHPATTSEIKRFAAALWIEAGDMEPETALELAQRAESDRSDHHFATYVDPFEDYDEA